MPNPIKVCVICSEEFELTPQKPGFANRCPSCSTAKPPDPVALRKAKKDADAKRRLRLASHLTDDQRSSMRRAEESGRRVVLMELTEPLTQALDFLQITDQRDEIATSATTSRICATLQHEADKLAKAKEIAVSSGQRKVVLAIESKIRELLQLKTEYKENPGILVLAVITPD